MPECKEAMDVKLSGSTEPPGGLDSVSVRTVCLPSGLMDDLIFPELSSPNEPKIPLEGCLPVANSQVIPQTSLMRNPSPAP